MDNPRHVFEAKANVSLDDKIDVELVVERTIVPGNRIRLVGEINYGEGRRRWIEIKGDVVHRPHNLEHQVRNERFR
jgi:hypothetical protein